MSKAKFASFILLLAMGLPHLIYAQGRASCNQSNGGAEFTKTATGRFLLMQQASGGTLVSGNVEYRLTGTTVTGFSIRIEGGNVPAATADPAIIVAAVTTTTKDITIQVGKYSGFYKYVYANITTLTGTGTPTATINACFYQGNIAGNGTTFDQVGAGANPYALEVAGSLDPTGGGTVNANEINGAAVPPSIGALGSDGDGKLVESSGLNLATPLKCPSLSGSATAYTCATDPTFTPADGSVVIWVPDIDCGATPTLAVNGATARSIKYKGGTVGLPSGSCQDDVPLLLTYNGTGNTWEFPDTADSLKSADVTPLDAPAAGYAATYCATCVSGGPGLEFDQRLPSAQIPTAVLVRNCTASFGDGLNAIAAGTYLVTNCKNDTGSTITLTGIQCYTDNGGSSTLNAADSDANGLLTGAITCTASFAAGTQSATTTLATGKWINMTFVADGTTKKATFHVKGTL